MKKRKTSLVWKLILCLLFFSLVPLCLILGIMSQTYAQAFMKQVRTVSEERTEFVNTYLDHEEDNIYSGIDMFVTDGNIEAIVKRKGLTTLTSDTIQNGLVSLCENNGGANAYLYSIAQGCCYAAYGENKENVPDQLGNLNWKRLVGATKEKTIRCIKTDDQCYLLYLKVLRRQDTGEKIGAVMLTVSADTLSDFLEKAVFSYGNIYVLYEDGTIIGEYGESRYVPDFSDDKWRQEGFKSIGGSLVNTVSTGFADVYLVTSCASKVYRYEEFQPFIKTILLASVMMLVSLVCAIAIIQRFLRPIRNLSDAMRHADPNDLVPVELSGSNDEAGILEQKYNELIDRINDMIEQKYKSELAAKEAQIYALQVQINPHFVNNTLQMIGMLAVERDMFDIYTMLTSFSRMFYYSLKFKGSFVSMSDEIRYIGDYLTLQKARYPERICYECNVDPQLEEVQVPKMILQPIVENCFKHAFSNEQKEWKVTVRAYAGNGKAVIEIEDNGCGMSQAKVRKMLHDVADVDRAISSGTSSIGMRNVNTRIVFLCGYEFGIRDIVSEEGKGTRVVVELPLNGGKKDDTVTSDR